MPPVPSTSSPTWICSIGFGPAGVETMVPAGQALVAVAHDADVAVRLREEEDELVLDGVGVLVLVDEDVLKRRW